MNNIVINRPTFQQRHQLCIYFGVTNTNPIIAWAIPFMHRANLLMYLKVGHVNKECKSISLQGKLICLFVEIASSK